MAGNFNHMNKPRLHVREAAPALMPMTHYARMGELLGTDITGEADAVRLAETGVSARAYKRMARELGFAHALIAPETTVRRRLKEGARFSEAESERLIRLARIYAEAVDLFGGQRAALDWLNTAQAYIPGEAPVTPMWLAARDSGARLVESLMRRTAYGIF